MADAAGFVSTASTAVVVFSVTAIILAVLRNDPEKYGWLLNPKNYQGVWDTKTCFTSADDEVIMDQGGMDGLVYVMFFRLLLKICTAGTLIGFVLMIVNAQGNSEDDDPLENISMANLKPKSDLFWFHLVAAYSFTFLTLKWLHDGYIEYNSWRHRYLAKADDRTAFVTGVVFHDDDNSAYLDSKQSDSSEDKRFQQFWKRSYPNEIASTQLAHDTIELESLISQKTEALAHINSLRKKVTEMKNMDGETQQNEPTEGYCPAKGMTHYTALVQELDGKIEAALPAQHVAAGFVTFTSTKTRDSAVLMPHVAQPLEFLVEKAPESRDMIWKAVTYSVQQKYIRYVVSVALTGLLIFFWTIPVAFVSSISTLTNLAKLLPFLKPILSWSPVIKSFLEGLLPSLALIIFLALLPKLLQAIYTFEGLISHSGVAKEVFKTFTMFQVLHTFLLVTLASSLSAVLDEIVDHPASIVELLGQSIPTVGTFFAGYTLLQGLNGFTMQVLDPGRLIMVSLGLGDIAELKKGLPLDYGKLYGNHILIAILAMAYSTVAPFVLVCAMIYFAVGYCTVKYQVLHQVVPQYESGGTFWPLLFDRLVVGLLISHFTLIGIFSLKESALIASLTIPLPIISVMFLYSMKSSYYLKGVYLPTSYAPLAGGDEAEEKKQQDDGGESTYNHFRDLQAKIDSMKEPELEGVVIHHQQD